jgi:hypothetical protein
VNGVAYLLEDHDLVKPDGTRYRYEPRPAHDGWRCSCPDFRFRGFRRPCKHLQALIDSGSIA